MCKKEVEKYAWSLNYVPDNFKTQEMYNNAVKKNHFYLHYAPDWFVAQQQLKTWHNEHGYGNDDELIRWWYEGCQK